MNPNAKKNRELIKQYPFLSDILTAGMEPYDGAEDTTIDDLTIRVEKADGDLMFRRADNVGLGDTSFVFQIKGKHSGLVGKRGEYIFAVNADNRIINRVNWPRNNEERRILGEKIYAWTVLWGTRRDRHYSNPIWDKVNFLVWVTVEAWHTNTRNDDEPSGRFGEPRDLTVCVTIYNKPEQGFEKLQQESNVYENLALDTRIMTSGVIEKDYDLVTMGGMIYEMCITFQDEVYFNGMKEILDAGEYRGASGQFGSVRVLVAEMCGYDRVMLSDSVSYVTFQLRPGQKSMYVLGQDGTLPQIRNLVRTVIHMWNQKPELRKSFKPDQNVSVM